MHPPPYMQVPGERPPIAGPQSGCVSRLGLNIQGSQHVPLIPEDFGTKSAKHQHGSINGNGESVHGFFDQCPDTDLQQSHAPECRVDEDESFLDAPQRILDARSLFGNPYATMYVIIASASRYAKSQHGALHRDFNNHSFAIIPCVFTDIKYQRYCVAIFFADSHAIDSKVSHKSCAVAHQRRTSKLACHRCHLSSRKNNSNCPCGRHCKPGTGCWGSGR